MTSIKKLFDKFLNYPPGLRYNEIERLLLYIGFQRIVAKGSHVKFKHYKLENDLIIPVHNNDCKNFYKIYAAKIIKKLIYEKPEN